MKKAKMFISILAVSFHSVASAAEGEFTPAQLVQASDVALKDYAKANAAHVAHMTGFKTWKAGVDAKVKIYVSHDGMTMESNYLCQQHGGQVHCSNLD